jgi:MFS family permease
MTAAAPSLPQADLAQRNFSHLVWDIAWFGLAFSALNRFLSVYALRLGADEAVLGWITSFPALLMTIAATFTLVWREKRTTSVRALMLPTFIYRLMFILPAFAPLLPESWRIPWIVITATIPGIGQGIGAVLFVVVLQEAVPRERMTELFSRRSLAFNIALAISAVAYGIWLEAVPFPYNYQAMFVIAFIMAMLSQWHCSRIEALHTLSTSVTTPLNPEERPFRSRDFRAVLVILMITFIGFNAVTALIPARLVEEMGANEGYMALFGLVELFAGALVSFFAPRFVEKLGVHRMIALSMLATAIGIAILGLSDSLVLGLFAAGISGAGWMLVAMIGVVSLYVNAVPVHHAVHYSIAYHQAAGLVTFAAPFIGTGLIDSSLNLSQIMLVGAGMRVSAALAIGVLWCVPAPILRRMAGIITGRRFTSLPSGSPQAAGSVVANTPSPKG